MFFVQIGANDGKSGDPLYEFIINHNWKGILVEPMPDVFEQLKENFSFASGRLIFENSAISDTGGEFTLYYIDNSEKKFPEW
ncbi:MAG: FkbM family methyltransferase [Chitinophagaceae bacterium]|nr:FkbM family methyltransferase [Chitinophagaceae bacterium]